jgi:hypothetical protein
MSKFMLNSLYGKFGQMGRVWHETGETREQDGKFWIVEDPQTKGIHKQRVRMGNVQEMSSEEETENSFPGVAAFVTGYARMLLWSLMQKAGLKNVYYTDTDSLIVNSTGYKALQRSGDIDPDRLGALKVEYIVESAIFRGSKDYEVRNVVWPPKDEGMNVEHIKGVSHRAERVGRDTYEQDHFFSWDYLAARDHDGYIDVERMRKHLARDYDKGTVTESGRVEPIRLGVA